MLPTRRRLIAASLALAALPFGKVRAADVCKGAATNILGPAYRKGAPFRTSLAANNEPGTKLTMSGTVTDARTCKPLRDAVLDVWQVNLGGDYDHEGADFHLRGKFRSADDGSYSFDTIEPVPYGVRPKHIHFLATREGYEPHITQCYFDGDDRNDKDPYVKKELIITPVVQDGKLHGLFDIVLRRETPPDRNAVALYKEFAGVYQIAEGVELTVVAKGSHLYWHLNRPEEEGDARDGEFAPRTQSRFFVPEYDIEGTFVRNEHHVVDHILDSRGILMRKIS